MSYVTCHMSHADVTCLICPRSYVNASNDPKNRNSMKIAETSMKFNENRWKIDENQ